MSPASEITLAGPWEHRTIAARGARFHVAEMGDGPLVLLLHGFPEFWWTWRHQLPVLAEAGYRAVAMDLRGFGGSDHTPRGYDLPSVTGDVASIIASLGARDAIVVGHDLGALVAWTLACYEPKAVRRLAVVSAPHPLRLRSALFRRPDKTRNLWSMQPPWLPERTFRGASSSRVDALLHQWAAPGWPDLPTAFTYRHAFASGNTAYCAAEYHRWFVRSIVRRDGARFRKRLQTPVTAPVLQVHGSVDGCYPAALAQGSSKYVEAPYRWRLLEGVGHFPHEEDPDRFSAELVHWLEDPEPDR
ncbi:MAG: alpha/beta fold hydrolase [Actinomycetes bacterium]